MSEAELRERWRSLRRHVIGGLIVSALVLFVFVRELIAFSEGEPYSIVKHALMTVVGLLMIVHLIWVVEERAIILAGWRRLHGDRQGP